MQAHAAERRYLERQIAYARPIFLLLGLVDLLVRPDAQRGMYAVEFLCAYLAASLAIVFLDVFRGANPWQWPLEVDILALAVFLFLSSSVIAFWFPFLFVALAAGIRWGLRPSVVLVGAASLALMGRAVWAGPVGSHQAIPWLGLAAGTFAAGLGMAFLGDRNRAHVAEHEFLTRLASHLHVERGVAESLRRVLDELGRTFECDLAFLVFRDAEIERIFLWTVRVGEQGRIVPDSLPLQRGEGFLLDAPDASLAWTSLDGAGKGFGWDRRTGHRLEELPRMPATVVKELSARNFLSVTFDFNNLPAGRILLANARRRIVPSDLRSHFARSSRRHSANAAQRGHTTQRHPQKVGPRARAGGRAARIAATHRPQRDRRTASVGHGYAPARRPKRRFGGFDARLRRALPQRVRHGFGPANRRRGASSA
jgi:hypothetical protein